MLVMIMGMSFVSSAIFSVSMMGMLPYLGLGIIFWSVISTSINDGSACLIGNSDLIKNSNLGIGNFVGRTVFKIYITTAVVIYILNTVLPTKLPIPKFEFLIRSEFPIRQALPSLIEVEITDQNIIPRPK